MQTFTFEVDGITEFERGFNRIGDFISDFRSIWGEVAKIFYQIEGEQFESQGAAGASGAWASLKKSYAEYKAVHYPGQTILKATGELYRSMTSFDASASIFRPEPDQLTIGTTSEGAIWHQRGTSRMPARKVISMSDSQKRRLQKAIQVGLVQFVRRQGFQVEGI